MNSTHREALSMARKYYSVIKRRNKRRQPYIRSAYFYKHKVFVGVFWDHLSQKNSAEQTRRLSLYACALEVIRNSRHDPDAVIESTGKDVILYRFYGRSREGLYFCVQIKHNRRTGRKDFMSVFPINKDKK